MDKEELELFGQQLEGTTRCRFWTWDAPQVHHPFLSSWPPGYLAALARWSQLPWRVQQLLAIDDHDSLVPGLRAWIAGLGFEPALLHQVDYAETEFRQLATVAVPAMTFLRGLLWRADPEIARIREWPDLQVLLMSRKGSTSCGAENESITSPSSR